MTNQANPPDPASSGHAPAVGPGSRIAGYLLEEQIGAGGMAVVFRAVDERLDRTVALKLLAPAMAADDDFRQRFIRESRAAARIDEPHVIPVYEAGEADGVLFIAMRYVRGGDVRSLMPAAGGLPPARVASIISQAAAALDAAHREGLIHRDVKPANMLLDHHGGQDYLAGDHIYLSDFGLSKSAAHTTGLTRTGMFLGTLDYIAPEQIEGQPVDGRADQYALACAAFELLSGRPPFSRADYMALMYAHLHDEPPPLASRMPAAPAGAGHVLRRALSKSPADRYPSCGDFARALSHGLGLAGAPAPVPADGAGHPQTEAAHMPPSLRDTGPAMLPGATRDAHQVPAHAGRPVAAGRKRRASLLIALACAVVAAAVAASLLLFQPTRPSAAGRTGPGTGTTSTGGTSSPSGSPSSAGKHHAGRTQGQGEPASQAGRYEDPRQLGPGGPGSSISYVSWAATSGLVATSDKKGSTYLWDAATGGQQGPPLAGPRRAYTTALNPDGTIVATGYSNGTIRLWNTATGSPLATLAAPGGAGDEVNAIAFSPDGGTLAAAYGNGNLELWNVAGGAPSSQPRIASDPAGAGIYSVVFSKQGMLATGDYDGYVDVWNATSLTPLGNFRVPGDSCTVSTVCEAVSGLAFDASGTVLAAGNISGNAELWSVSGHTTAVIDTARTGAPPAIWGMSFSAQTLAIASSDGHVYLWQVTPAALKAAYRYRLTDPGTGGLGVGSVAFSPNGQYLVTGDTNGSAYLWQRVTAAPGNGQAWTGSKLTITPTSLGAVSIGSTPAEASRSAGEPLRPVGDGVWYPRGVTSSGLAIAVGRDGGVTCVSASRQPSVPIVTTPQGFQLGGTLAQLKAAYRSSLVYVPAPTGGISPVPGYVVRSSSGNLAFWLSGGIVRRISAGPGVLPSTECS